MLLEIDKNNESTITNADSNVYMKYMSDFIIYLYTMKVKELIEKLKEYDENKEICFGIPNTRSCKWDDIELEIDYLGDCNFVVFSQDGNEYPTYEKTDIIYIGFKDISDKAL